MLVLAFFSSIRLAKTFDFLLFFNSNFKLTKFFLKLNKKANRITSKM